MRNGSFFPAFAAFLLSVFLFIREYEFPLGNEIKRIHDQLREDLRKSQRNSRGSDHGQQQIVYHEHYYNVNEVLDYTPFSCVPENDLPVEEIVQQ